MADNMRCAFVVALLSAALVSSDPATAGKTLPGAAAEPLRQLYYSPWRKFCGKGSAPFAKEVCFTGADARSEAGQPVVAAALIEPEGEARKLFRVTLPAQLDSQYGARIIVDADLPVSTSAVTCFATGCMADFESTPELIDRLMKGRMLQVQAINLAATPVVFPLPLVHSSGNSFASAHDGPASDLYDFERERKRRERQRWRGDFDTPLRKW